MRLTRRGIARALRAPVPDPPPELGRRLKEQIPEDLFAARATASESRRPARRRAPWAVAASLLVAIGSGYLAVRLFEDREGTPGQQLADFDRPGMTDEAAHSPARQLDPVAGPAAGPVAAPVAESAPTTPDSQPRLGAVAGAGGPEMRASEPATPPVAARSAESAKRIEAENQEIREQGQRIRELVAEKRKLEREMRARPGTMADTEASPGTDRSSPRPDSDDAYLEVAAQPISTLTLTVGQRSLQAVGSAADADPGLPLGEILDLATRTRAAAHDQEIEVAGTPTRRTGHVALLLSAAVAESGRDQGEPGPAGSIELELDPAAARRYRLLASHAHRLATTATTTSAPAPAAGRESGAPVYRLTALVEIELAPGAAAGANLGAVRLRGIGGDAGTARIPARPIGTGDVAAGWEQAPVELRLAVLGAELALLPRAAGADLLAPIAQDLERLLTDPSLEPAAARLAADLAAAARRRTGPDGSPAGQPAAPPARDDG